MRIICAFPFAPPGPDYGAGRGKTMAARPAAPLPENESHERGKGFIPRLLGGITACGIVEEGWPMPAAVDGGKSGFDGKRLAANCSS
jgi:hypothetical protein